MVGIKGKAGRKRKYPDNPNDPIRERSRKASLEWYYKNKKRRLKKMHDYHKKNAETMKYAAKHKLTIPEARRILAQQKGENK